MSALKVCPQCGTEYPANARFCETDGTALRAASDSTDLVGSIIADRYHVLRKLGEGGMGEVYLAEHVKMGRKSALKVMHPAMKANVDAISRFNREAANASRIAHANVAAVYDFGETPDGIIYLAMELVDGPPLTTIIEQQGALPPTRAAEIVRQTAEALAVAHDMGIVHRDLKPDNIMIARNRDGSDCVKVVDFGIAKAAGNDAQKVTKTGLVVGTPDYMSPEQLAGDKLDGRSDIYALALVAFNMLTGKLPFPSDSAQEAMIMRLTDKPKRLADMRPETRWPADVQAVMDKGLERDVNARYQNAIEFGMALYNAVARMPETQAMQIGTQELSVPATRVAPGAGVAPDVGTAAAPTRQVSAPAVTQAAAKSRLSNKVGAVVTAVAVVIAVGIAAVKLAGNGRVGTAPTTAPAPANATPPVEKMARQLATQTGKSVAGTPDSSGGRTPTNSAPAGVAPADVDARLATLLGDAQAPATADAALRNAAKLDLKTEDQKAEAAWVRAQAYLTKEDSKSACKELNDIVNDHPGSKRVGRAKNLIEAGC
ncbi:MAG TPA: serine/threonine-protein kinase [Gemmatimonadaceae bacterium]|nr:serine/threonine-protein kinase [Gemmatimonadaceae bacterium]